MHSLADLHTHTNYSDGALTSEELLPRANHAGISALSITDHDTVDGVAEAIRIGNNLSITVIAGVELSVSLNQREVHLLGYFFDPDNAELKNCLALLREQRIRRAERIVEKLNALNIPLKMGDVLRHAGKGVVCRPHIAEAMVENKFVTSYFEVFQKYIGDNGPAYEKKPEFPLEKAVQMIANAGGLSFLAHPGMTINGKELSSIISLGIDGIETVHPSHTAEIQRYYKGITDQYYLLECGGSDYHGGLRNDERHFGQYGISLDAVERMRQRLGC